MPATPRLTKKLELAVMRVPWLHRDTDDLRSVVWHALLGAYIMVAAAPTVIDVLEKAAPAFHGFLF
jgi:hypothetical protein